jgi:hypothetical protein
MSLPDGFLIDPTPQAIVAALRAAAERRPAQPFQGDTFSGWPPEDLATALTRCRDEPSGVHVWSEPVYRARQVLLAWVTASDGRKLVRALDGLQSIIPEALEAIHTPRSWHAEALVYREWVYCFQRIADAEPEVILACDCGASGRPAELAWHDVRCGPCQDRLTEGVPLPEPLCRHRRDLSVDGNLPVAVTPDGQRMVLASLPDQPREIRIASLDTRRTWRKLADEGIVKLASFSADGTRLALLSLDGSRSYLHVREYPGVDSVAHVELPGLPMAVALSPDGRIAYASTQEGSPAWGTLYRIDLDGDRTPLQIAPPHGDSEEVLVTLSCSPDGRWLAGVTRSRAVVLLDRRVGTFIDLGTIPRRVLPGICFTPDSSALLCLGMSTITVLAVPSGEILGMFSTPLPDAMRCTLVGPWVVILQRWGASESVFLPWQPLLDFVRRKRRAGA